MARRTAEYPPILTSAEIAEGMSAALRNAEDLLDDARLLLKNERYPRAASLAVLAMEEVGKAVILSVFIFIQPSDDGQKLWRAFFSHTDKAFISLKILELSQRVRKLEEMLEYLEGSFSERSDYPKFLGAIKELGMYSDYLAFPVGPLWSIPNETIGLEIARDLVIDAENMLCFTAPTADEIELLKTHVGSLSQLDSGLEGLRAGVHRLFRDLQKHGYIDVDDKTLEQFLSP